MAPAPTPRMAPRLPCVAPRLYVVAPCLPCGCHSHSHSPATRPEGDHRPHHRVARGSCAGASRGALVEGLRRPCWLGCGRASRPGALLLLLPEKRGRPGHALVTGGAGRAIWPGRAGRPWSVPMGCHRTARAGAGMAPAGMGMAPVPAQPGQPLAPGPAPGRFLAAIALPHGNHSPNQRPTRAICGSHSPARATRAGGVAGRGLGALVVVSFWPGHARSGAADRGWPHQFGQLPLCLPLHRGELSGGL